MAATGTATRALISGPPYPAGRAAPGGRHLGRVEGFTASSPDVQDVQLRTGVPCAFGVLTVESMEQALARAGGDKRDQGAHAAETVLRMAALRDELG